MVYEEKVEQTIKYTLEDILGWAKIFAAKQFGISDNEIKDENITIPENSDQFSIRIKVTKLTSNQKDDKTES